jgi:hypothetical protein
MPGKRIPELPALSGATSANDDDIVVFDTSGNETKRISRSQLAEGMIDDLPFLYFHGVRTDDPTERFNGDPIEIGDGYLRSSDMIFRYFTPSGWQNYEQIAVAAAQAWAEGTEPGGAGTKSSREWSLVSEGEANRAEVARDDAQGVLADRLRRDVATLLADTTLTYTAAQPGTVTAGDIIRTRAEGFSYEVAPSSATDHHVTTAGGVKLYRVYAPQLRAVSSQSLPVQAITLPATFNNKLGARLYSDGSKVRYLVNPYDLIDFTSYEAVTDYYVNFVTGNNTNDGLSSGTAWKTFDYAIANMTLPAVLNVEDEIVGFLSKGAAGGGTTVSGKLKVKSASPSGRTIFAAMREDRLVGAFSWTASGSNGAYVSTTAAALFYRAQFDAKFRDGKGIPLPITAAADIAECQDTRGTYFWDAANSHLYVHMHDGRIPNPADGWLYAQSAFRHQFNQALDTPDGVILFENCEFLSNTGIAPNANWRFRPVTAGPSESPNESYVGLRNCLAYGGSTNQFEVYDAGVTVLDNCHAKWSRKDCFNYHSFRTADTRGEYMTVYEHDCTGFYAGFDGFADQPALGTSENGSSAHDSMHILRTNTVAGTCRGAVVADVNGCHSLNYNVGAGDPGAGSPKALFWHEKFQGVGTTKEMILWGCYGTDGGDASVLLTSNIAQSGGVSNDGTIKVQHWRGQIEGKLQGSAFDIDGVALL